MKILFMYIWLFPILFMIHDFEEIFMVNAWQQKNKHYIESRKDKYIPYNFKASTAAFSIGVDIEFALISIVTIISYLLNSYVIWFGLFIAFVVHLFLHIIMCINFKGYVPGVITGTIVIPVSCFMIYRIYILLNFNMIIFLFSILIGTLFMLGMIYVLHKATKKFNYWLERYNTSYR
ncbi:HXXEE domain-containing protein [Clostridium akagii]|uniref:HXXEE domain-containing protein n=1 Tax=Clostridium akagii TaxID=91623 RepID=UPI000479A9EE|nr:HXXEE domain-containing protein [Clostridium akagii]